MNLTTNTKALLLAAAACLCASAAMATSPKPPKCTKGEVGGIVKAVKTVGNKTVMTFVGSTMKITIPSERPEAKALAKVKPGTLHCEIDDTDL
ncbi:MAG: hypothetical protein GXD23_15205 [Comamonadaceae bacterium]|jgi:hypothetical protein|uniref:hypothetical protein n=1 Tax=Hydrogenophaga sp. PML113 TaxID=1899350 RepID=UPI000878CD25|nr:hypothetical protein [Hydrogenophaga sp. PML113]NCT98713.1 hypothetical protein [Comamonadaceae bacterium]